MRARTESVYIENCILFYFRSREVQVLDSCCCRYLLEIAFVNNGSTRTFTSGARFVARQMNVTGDIFFPWTR